MRVIAFIAVVITLSACKKEKQLTTSRTVAAVFAKDTVYDIFREETVYNDSTLVMLAEQYPVGNNPRIVFGDTSITLVTIGTIIQSHYYYSYKSTSNDVTIYDARYTFMMPQPVANFAVVKNDTAIILSGTNIPHKIYIRPK